MCFSNDLTRLTKLRARKSPITVWKSGYIDDDTGRVSTEWDGGGKDRIWWVKGTVVKPTKIRPPLGKRGVCSAGLYFCVKKEDVQLSRNGYGHRALITARVSPQDIIGVSCDGLYICCVAAKVIEAPNPNQRAMRLRWLNGKITRARDERREREEAKKLWLEEQEDKAECLERMVAEAADLRGPKKGSKRASKS